jgi:hypothetical protein
MLPSTYIATCRDSDISNVNVRHANHSAHDTHMIKVFILSSSVKRYHRQAAALAFSYVSVFVLYSYVDSSAASGAAVEI